MALEHLTAHLTMGQETLAECLDDHTKSLLLLHWQEIVPDSDIPLDPDYDAYYALEKQGWLRCYILRDHGIAVGYAVFTVGRSLKHRSSIQAMQDILYILPSMRHTGVGGRFLQWCDEQLAKEGVQIVRHGVEATYDFGALLKRLGYAPEQTLWARRLDGCAE